MEHVSVIQAPTEHALILGLAGELDIATAPALAEMLLDVGAHLPPPSLVVLDLHDLGFLSAAGVGVFLDFAGACAQRDVRTCLLLNPASLVHRVSRLTGLDQALPVFETSDQAIVHHTRRCSAQ